MKPFIFIAGLGLSLTFTSTFANEPDTEAAEKVEPVERSEFIRQQNATFNKADKNFDGKITHDEILALSHEVNKPKYVAAFKEMDTNNNGFISSDELEARHEALTSQRIARFSNTKDTLLRTYDADGNGTITSREIEAYSEKRSQNLRDKTATNAARDMKGKDSDNSGSVSLTEYIDSKTPTAVISFRGAEATNLSLTRDPNGDKIITRSENESFIDLVFLELDKNKDDKLSAAEQSNKIFGRVQTLSTRRFFFRKNGARHDR